MVNDVNTDYTLIFVATKPYIN